MQFPISKSHAKYIYLNRLPNQVFSTESSEDVLTSPNVFSCYSFTISNPRCLVRINRSPFLLKSDVSTMWTPSLSIPSAQKHLISNLTST